MLQITLFTAIFFVNWISLWVFHTCHVEGNLQHKQTWRRVNVTHGPENHPLPNMPAGRVPTTGSNLSYHRCKNHVKQYGESLRMRRKQVQSSAQHKPPTQTFTRGVCPRHTIWQRITKMEGDNSCRYNLHLQRHGLNLHGGETGVSWFGATTRPKVPNANWYVTRINAKITCKTGKPPQKNIYTFVAKNVGLRAPPALNDGSPLLNTHFFCSADINKTKTTSCDSHRLHTFFQHIPDFPGDIERISQVAFIQNPD